MSRTRRVETIRRLLQAGPVESQESLRLELGRLGIEATQATISRDLASLGALKGPGGYILAGASPEPAKDEGAASDELTTALSAFAASVVVAHATVVIKTGPGHASPIALELDRTPPAGVVGTIAGDDTIFVATASPDEALHLASLLRDAAALAPSDMGATA